MSRRTALLIAAAIAAAATLYLTQVNPGVGILGRFGIPPPKK